MQTYVKHPDATIAIPIVYNDLGSNTLSNPTVLSTTPVGLTASASVSGNRVIVLVSGGAAGTEYQVEVRVDVSNGEKPVAEFLVNVVNN